MVIFSKRNVLFRNGNETHYVKTGYVGEVPSWVPRTQLFVDMVADGQIVVAESTKDTVVEKAYQKADETEKKARARHKAKVEGK